MKDALSLTNSSPGSHADNLYGNAYTTGKSRKSESRWGILQSSLSFEVMIHQLLIPQDNGLSRICTGASGFVIEKETADNLKMAAFGGFHCHGMMNHVQSKLRQCKSFSLGPLTMKDPIFMEMPLTGIVTGGPGRIVGIIGWLIVPDPCLMSHFLCHSPHKGRTRSAKSKDFVFLSKPILQIGEEVPYFPMFLATATAICLTWAIQCDFSLKQSPVQIFGPSWWGLPICSAHDIIQQRYALLFWKNVSLQIFMTTVHLLLQSLKAQRNWDCRQLACSNNKSNITIVLQAWYL